MSKSLSPLITPATVLTREQFKVLNTTNDRIAMAHMLMRLLLNFSLVFSLIYASREGFYLGVLLVWIAYSIQFHFWGYAGIGHELLHRRVFSSKSLNDLLFQFCSSLTWNNAAMFRNTHMLHHRDAFSEDDAEAKSVQDWSVISFSGYLLIDIKMMIRRISYVIINAFGYYPNLAPLDSSYTTSARITLATNFLLYSLFYFLSNDAIVSLLLLVSPFSFSLLSKILAKAQHHELAAFREQGALKFSRTLILPKFLSFLYANMNYHAEHHFAPSIPYYNLPDFHEILIAKGLISSQSIWSFFNAEFQTVWSTSTEPQKTEP